jgi:hypothetical protein
MVTHGSIRCKDFGHADLSIETNRIPSFTYNSSFHIVVPTRFAIAPNITPDFDATGDKIHHWQHA